LKVKDMKPSKRKKAQMALMSLTEKRDKSVKGRMVYNRKPTREWLSREDAASPTTAPESIMITGVIEAKEQRDMMTCATYRMLLFKRYYRRKIRERIE
jgi:hypothetical protein